MSNNQPSTQTAQTASILPNGTPFERHLDGLFVIRAPLTLAGIPFGTRTSVVRLPDGTLTVVAPAPGLTPHIEAIKALGPVRHVVAPNLFHHLSLPKVRAWFPEACLWYAPGLLQKVGGKKGYPSPDETLPETRQELPWSSVLDSQFVAGQPKLGETVFLHKASRSLVLTDLAFNFPRMPRLGQRIFLSLAGCHNRLGPSRFARSMVKDKPRYADSIRALANWNFDRIIMAHGDILESQADQAFASAFAAYLPRPGHEL